MFKLYINELPTYLRESPDTVFLNNIPLQCLMYADDIVLLTSSREGLQKRLDGLRMFCKDWCLDVNICKIEILIFNKTGKLLKDEFSFVNAPLECVQHYRYLGVNFSASGIFNFAQDDIFKKSSKTSFKLTKLITSSEPSFKTIHLFDHLLNPLFYFGQKFGGCLKRIVLHA